MHVVTRARWAPLSFKACKRWAHGGFAMSWKSFRSSSSSQLHILRLLIAAAGDVNAAAGPKTGATPLICAVRSQDLSLVRVLLEASAATSINREDAFGHTALMHAAHIAFNMLSNNSEGASLIALLLRYRADVNAEFSEKRCTTLCWLLESYRTHYSTFQHYKDASQSKDKITEIATMLVGASADVSREGFNGFDVAVCCASIKLTRLFVSAGACTHGILPLAVRHAFPHLFPGCVLHHDRDSKLVLSLLLSSSADLNDVDRDGRYCLIDLAAGLLGKDALEQPSSLIWKGADVY